MGTELEPGTVIADRYRVVERLGDGGMGVVYSVEHTHMRKLFALKVLHRELLKNPEVVSRFEREAVLAGSINHPNVAAATDFGKLEDGSFFLILELVVGKSLRALIAEGPLEVTRAGQIMRGIVAGVAAAHAKGIVHRDLKPDNVMLVERDGVSDFVKVLDFGIAKGGAVAGTRPSAAQPLTQIGAVMGTPDYMSPEQALGQAVDHRSDLYSLGVIFFELITGAAPFRGDGLQVLRQHLTAEAPPIPAELTAGVVVPIASIVAKLLAKEPDARFQSAAELLAAFDTATATPPRSARLPGVAAATTTGPAVRRWVTPVASLAGAVFAVTILATLFTHQAPAAQTTAADQETRAEANALSASAPAASEAPPTVIVSPSADLDEPNDESAAPAASAATSAAPPVGRASHGRRSPTGRPAAPRRTGPGGIYIPSLRELFR